MQSTFAFIFDLDGTLFDSETQISSALNKVRIEFGFLPKSQEDIASLIGLPAKELLGDLKLSDHKISKMIDYFRSELQKSILESNPMFPNAENFVRKVKSSKFMVGVATSKPSYLAKQVIGNSPLSGLVDHIQGTDDFLAKPEPAVIHHCLSELATDSGVMFGDRIEDIEAANRAGISAVGIAQTKHSVDELKIAGASLVFSSFSEALTNFDLLIDRLIND
jgi:phosphoglycolate phosphatase